MTEKSRDRMKHFIEEKHHKDSMNHDKPMRKIGKTHKAFKSQKHGGPLSRDK